VAHKDKAEVRFVPYEEGEYTLHVRYNGFMLPYCPMIGLLHGAGGGGRDQPMQAATTTGKVRLTGKCNTTASLITSGEIIMGTT
jgi:hypothetical protein